MDRKDMLEKLGQYSFVPGHGPNFEEMTDEELDEYLFELESALEKHSKNKKKEG